MATVVKNRDQLVAKRTRVVQMRLEGHTLQAIADANGLAGHAGVRYHLDAWMAEQRPSSEQTEELRQLQAAQIDALNAKLWPMLDSDDYLAVVDRIAKLMDRKARLFGLDLAPSMMVGLVTAEGMAALFGLDAGEPAIEGTATELAPGEGA